MTFANLKAASGGPSLAARALHFAALLLASWCMMSMTHESGHLVGGWWGGGTLQYAELRPWRLPHSHFEPDPQPLLTIWSGPILGVLIPVGVAAAVRRRWSWFLANFCLLANGSYLAAAWVTGDNHLDTARLLSAGAWPGSIAAYCLITIGVGYVRFRASCRDVLSGRKDPQVPPAPRQQDELSPAADSA